jgi:hypothetical protein
MRNFDRNFDKYKESVPCSIPEELKGSLVSIAEHISAVAQQCDGDNVALLTLLRTLEAAHREICDNAFQEALPKNRQQLYSFLRDIESQGGWPYIPRMKLRSLLQNISPEELKDLGLGGNSESKS